MCIFLIDEGPVSSFFLADEVPLSCFVGWFTIVLFDCFHFYSCWLLQSPRMLSFLLMVSIYLIWSVFFTMSSFKRLSGWRWQYPVLHDDSSVSSFVVLLTMTLSPPLSICLDDDCNVPCFVALAHPLLPGWQWLCFILCCVVDDSPVSSFIVWLTLALFSYLVHDGPIESCFCFKFHPRLRMA